MFIYNYIFNNNSNGLDFKQYDFVKSCECCKDRYRYDFKYKNFNCWIIYDSVLQKYFFGFDIPKRVKLERFEHVSTIFDILYSVYSKLNTSDIIFKSKDEININKWQTCEFLIKKEIDAIFVIHVKKLTSQLELIQVFTNILKIQRFIRNVIHKLF